MYFDYFRGKLVYELGDDSIYDIHLKTGESLNSISKRLISNPSLLNKSLIYDVIWPEIPPLSNTTNNKFSKWITECKQRLLNSTDYSQPWVFKVNNLKDDLLSLFPLPIKPNILYEEMIQESVGINTLLVNNGINCVLQKSVRGPRYKQFSSPLFTKGGDCDIYCTYTQEIIKVPRSYIIIGITTENYPSAIELDGVFPSIEEWQNESY